MNIKKKKKLDSHLPQIRINAYDLVLFDTMCKKADISMSLAVRSFVSAVNCGKIKLNKGEK